MTRAALVPIDGVITGAVNLALFGLVVLVRRLVHHEGLAAFGLRKDARSWRLLVAGLLAGTLLFSIYPIAAVALGVGRVAVAWPARADTVMLLVGWGFGYAGVALFEEGLFRGYLQSKLRARFTTVPAVIGQALLFGMFHLVAYPQSRYVWLGVVNVAVLAVVQAMFVLLTHSLMMAVGFHVAWDLVQTMLLMQQTRGGATLLNLHVSEGMWAGTAYAPETGLIVSVVAVGCAVWMASTLAMDAGRREDAMTVR